MWYKHRNMVKCPTGSLSNGFELVSVMASFPIENLGICGEHEVILLVYKLGAL